MASVLNMTDSLLDPLIWVLLGVCVCSHVLLSVPPSSPRRLPWAATLPVLATGAHVAMQGATENRALKAFLSPVMGFVCLHALELLLISRASAADVGFTAPAAGLSLLGRFRVGLAAPVNWARLGTPWELRHVRRVREFVARTQAGRRRPRDWRAFLLRKALKITAASLLLDVLTLLDPPRPELAAAHKTALFSRWKEVTAGEMLFRLCISLVWGAAAAAAVTYAYDMVQFVGVLVGWATPDDFPPVFGSLSSAYTVGRFWGDTWHQTLRRMLESIGNWAVRPVDAALLPLRERSSRLAALASFASGYVRMLLAFTISGLVHWTLEPGMDIPPGERTQIWFFCVQPVAILIERLVMAAYRRYSPVRLGPTCERAVGYIWVLAFFAWTGPSFSYAIMRRMEPAKDRGVPPLISPLLRRLYIRKQ